MRYSRIPTFLVWSLFPAIAWHLGSLIVAAPSLSTVAAITDPIQRLYPAAVLSLFSILVAAPIAVAGSFLLRPFLRRPSLWVLTTLLGLPVGYGSGLLVGSGGSGRPSPLFILAWTGLWLALAQLPALSPRLVRQKRRLFLWVLGVPAAMTAGWLAAEILLGGAAASLYDGRGLLMGGVSGLLVYGLLAVLDTGEGLETQVSGSIA